MYVHYVSSSLARILPLLLLCLPIANVQVHPTQEFYSSNFPESRCLRTFDHYKIVFGIANNHVFGESLHCSSRIVLSSPAHSPFPESRCLRTFDHYKIVLGIADNQVFGESFHYSSRIVLSSLAAPPSQRAGASKPLTTTTSCLG